MANGTESDRKPEGLVGLDRRLFLRRAGLVGGVALTPFLAALSKASAAAGDSCLTIPADKSAANYTFTAAYAASPPAVDEIAFTMETENVLALTYGGDFMQYKPVSSGTPGICVADMAAAGNEGVIGRWVDKWESSPDYETWTFHIKPGAKSWAGNEMTSADITWTWQRAAEMKSARFFFMNAMFLGSPDDVEAVDKHTVRFHLTKPSPVILKLMAMSYYGGPFNSKLAKEHATASDPWAKDWLKIMTRASAPTTS